MAQLGKAEGNSLPTRRFHGVLPTVCFRSPAKQNERKYINRRVRGGRMDTPGWCRYVLVGERGIEVGELTVSVKQNGLEIFW